MTGLEQIYMASCVVGFVYIIGTALLGQFHQGDSGDPGGGPEHGAHNLNHGHSSVSEHVTQAHGADHGHLVVDHSAGSLHGHGVGHGSHTGSVSAHGHSTGSSHGDGHQETQKFDLSSTAQHTKIIRPTSQSQDLYFKLLKAVSPTRLSLFLLFAGATGTLSLKLMPFLGLISLIPALLVGAVISNAMFNALGLFMTKLSSSTNFQDESLIGTVGELTLPIGPNNMGEIVISNINGRHNGPAKPYNPDQEIKKLTKVIVSDYRDGIFYVVPYEDETVSG